MTLQHRFQKVSCRIVVRKNRKNIARIFQWDVWLMSFSGAF